VSKSGFQCVSGRSYRHGCVGNQGAKAECGICPAPWLSGILVIRRSADSIMVTLPRHFASGITARICKLDAQCRRAGANS
jgi:hypothetical protein